MPHMKSGVAYFQTRPDVHELDPMLHCKLPKHISSQPEVATAELDWGNSGNYLKMTQPFSLVKRP